MNGIVEVCTWATYVGSELHTYLGANLHHGPGSSPRVVELVLGSLHQGKKW